MTRATNQGTPIDERWEVVSNEDLKKIAEGIWTEVHNHKVDASCECPALEALARIFHMGYKIGKEVPDDTAAFWYSEQAVNSMMRGLQAELKTAEDLLKYALAIRMHGEDPDHGAEPYLWAHFDRDAEKFLRRNGEEKIDE